MRLAGGADAVGRQPRRAGERTGAVNPFTRIALEAAVLIIGLIVFAILLAYLLGVFNGPAS